MSINIGILIASVNHYFFKTAVISDPKLQELSKLPSYAARIRFADASWPKIRAGSGRIVYDYGPELVLKLAKNEKGIQQNITENDGFIQDNYKDLIANVIDGDPNDIWMVVEKASKITPTEFRTLTGIDFNDLAAYLKYRLTTNENFITNISEDLKEKLDNNQWVQEIWDMAGNFEMPVGDLARISSWGKIKGKAVLTDYGLTKSILEEYYSR